jgi:predicted protein tyrosine phosphatase
MDFKWNNFNINSIHTDKIFGVISRNEFIKINKFIPESKLIAISILQPGVESFDLDILGKFKKFRTFHFNDVTVSDYDYSNQEPISFELANEIKNFILENKEEQFLIHCMAGQSRSAGVAKAIECLTLFDGDVYAYKTCFSSLIDSNPRYTPNLTVFDRIVK